MQISLPNDPRIESKARAAGFQSVEEYVLHLIEQDSLVSDASSEMTRAEWQRRFDAFLASLEPGNPNVDDSRESIYSSR